jgi:hypothetical protein
MPADGVVTGAASIAGRTGALASQDFTVAGGAAGEVHIRQSRRDHDALAEDRLAVHLHQRFRRRARAGRHRFALAGYGKVFYTNVMLSGAVPQISLICGPCAGGAAYSPALTDFIIQTRRRRCSSPGRRSSRGHRRSRHRRGTGRRGRAHDQVGRDPLHRRKRSTMRFSSAISCSVFCRRTTWKTRPGRGRQPAVDPTRS